MSDTAPLRVLENAQVAAPAGFPGGRFALVAGTAWRLGPAPLGFWLLHRAAGAAGLPRRALARALGGAAPPGGAMLPAAAPPAPPLPPGAASAVLAAAARLPAAPDWHGPFDPAAEATRLDLFGPGDVRPVWEANRLAALPLLVQAARIEPEGGHLARAEALLQGWVAQNPPFHGPAWACGQEAALRALHLALALALLQADASPPPGARLLLLRCAQRIRATALYARAQDNNHPVSEAAGLFVIALLLRDGAAAQRAARRLAASVARLVAADGGFAQVSPGYTRLLLDVLALAEWFRARHGAPAFPAPLAARAAAAATWLHRLADPASGATPRLGLEDGSALADLALAGPADARASVERAARLFAGAGADLPEDPGCAWLGLARPAARLARPVRWRAAGSLGWRQGAADAVLRTGPLRFRPGQADLLHLTLRQAGVEVLRDGGTGAYNPPAPWWWAALAGAAAHNGAVFDAAEPMPRLGRFLLGAWPRMSALPDGAALVDARGNRQARQVAVDGAAWTVTDSFAGPFRHLALHWRLPPGAWEVQGMAAIGAAARIEVAADAPATLSLLPGWESEAYGAIHPAPILRVAAAAPITRMVTRIRLAMNQRVAE